MSLERISLRRTLEYAPLTVEGLLGDISIGEFNEMCTYFAIPVLPFSVISTEEERVEARVRAIQLRRCLLRWRKERGIPVRPNESVDAPFLRGADKTDRTNAASVIFGKGYGMGRKDPPGKHLLNSIGIGYKALEEHVPKSLVDEPASTQHGALLKIRDAVARWANLDPATVTDKQLLEELKGETQNRVVSNNKLLCDIETLVNEREMARSRSMRLADKLQAIEDRLRSAARYEMRFADPLQLADWVKLPEGRDR